MVMQARNLRAYIMLVENERNGNVPFVKTWFHAADGEQIEMSFFDKHAQVARAHKREMGISGKEPAIEAVEKGWVRVSSSREGAERAEHGYVTARNAQEARAALRWMRDSENCLPASMDVEFYHNGQPSDFFTLVDSALDRFIDRGVRPRT